MTHHAFAPRSHGQMAPTAFCMPYRDRGRRRITTAPLKSWPGAGAKSKSSGQRGPAEAKWTYKSAREAGTLAHKIAFPHCNAQCISNQLDDYHKGCGIDDNTPLRSDPGSDKRSSGTLTAAQQRTVTQAIEAQKGITTGSNGPI